ncbi:MAG: GFA family protein [Pseudomonadota bacterium]
MTDSVSGSCFCGEVVFEIDLPTTFCGHCHCSMCRRPHGAAFVTWAAVPDGQFRLLRGESLLTTYKSSTHGRRQFCSQCGTQLFCFHVQEGRDSPELMDVPLATLHEPIDRKPQAHFYYDSKAQWSEIADDLPKLGGPSGTQPL